MYKSRQTVFCWCGTGDDGTPQHREDSRLIHIKIGELVIQIEEEMFLHTPTGIIFTSRYTWMPDELSLFFTPVT